MKTLMFSLALAALGCKSKASDDQHAAPAPAPAPAAPAPAAPAVPATDPPKPPPQPELAIKNEPPVEISGMPKECNDYKAAIERLQTCDKLGVTERAKLRHDYNTAAAAWNKLPDQQKPTLAAACKRGLDQVMKDAKKPCGW